MITQPKLMKDFDLDDAEFEFECVQTLMNEAKQSNKRVIFTDEAIFSKNTRPRMAFSQQLNNIEIYSSDLNTQKAYVIVAFSEQKGIESFRV